MIITNKKNNKKNFTGNNKKKKERQKEINLEKYKSKLKFYGKINDKIQLTLSEKSYKQINNKYGTSYLYILTDNNGHTFSFFLKSPYIVLDHKEIEIKATIKAHKEINGYKQTELKNVKVLNELDIENMTDEEIAALPF